MHERLGPQQWHPPRIYNYRKAGRASETLNKIPKKTYRKYIILYKKSTTIIIIQRRRVHTKTHRARRQRMTTTTIYLIAFSLLHVIDYIYIYISVHNKRVEDGRFIYIFFNPSIIICAATREQRIVSRFYYYFFFQLLRFTSGTETYVRLTIVLCSGSVCSTRIQ